MITKLNEFRLHTESVKSIVEKSEDQSYSYGCIMGYFDGDMLADLDDASEYDIDDEDIYNNDENEYGREIEPHVTVLYGLLDDKIDEDEVLLLLKNLKCPIVTGDDISCFTNDEYDVLKWDIESPELTLYNKILSSVFPFESKYPDYHAHSTIAYLKPGSGEKYSKEPTSLITKEIAYWVYSKADGKKIKITSDGEVVVIREAAKENKKDESFEYKGHLISIKMTKENLYHLTIFKDGNYIMGIKGLLPLIECKKTGMQFVNGQVSTK